MKIKGDFENLETGEIVTANGVTESKTMMGKEFELVQCTTNTGRNILVPIDKLNNKSYYTAHKQYGKEMNFSKLMF